MMWLEGGTTGDKMIEFIQMVLNAIGVSRYSSSPQVPHYGQFTVSIIIYADASSFSTFVNVTDAITTRCSSSSCHHKLQVVAMILAAGHWIVFRAPYYPMNLCAIP